MNKDTICLIPARSGSKGIKNKNLKKINNKSLTEITIRSALNSKVFKEIILSSDSETILKIGKKLKITTIKRGKENSKDSSTTDSVVKETIKKINIDYKNIVIMQVTSPLRKVKTITKFINYCKRNKLETCCTVTKIDEQIGHDQKYFNPILSNNNRRRQDRKFFLYENGLLYFVKKSFFTKKFKIYPNKNWNYFQTNKYESLDINDQYDLDMCRLLLQRT
jgi:CMP-N,N'-diacetyllegionaminic acid synthase